MPLNQVFIFKTWSMLELRTCDNLKIAKLEALIELGISDDRSLNDIMENAYMIR